MNTIQKILILASIILTLSASVSLIYYFVARPIQQDIRLDECLDSMWALYGNQDDLYKEKVNLCIKEIKGN